MWDVVFVLFCMKYYGRKKQLSERDVLSQDCKKTRAEKIDF